MISYNLDATHPVKKIASKPANSNSGNAILVRDFKVPVQAKDGVIGRSEAEIEALVREFFSLGAKFFGTNHLTQPADNMQPVGFAGALDLARRGINPAKRAA